MRQIRTVPAGRGIAWFTEGFDFFSRSAGTWLGIVLILFVGFIVLGFLPGSGLIAQLLTSLLMGGLMLGCQEAGAGGQLRLDHLFAGFRQNSGELFLLGVFYTIGMLIIIATMVILLFMGLGLNILKAIITNGDPTILVEHLMTLLVVLLVGLALYIPLLMAFWFAPALIMLEQQSAVVAMKDSFRGCLKNMPAFLLYGVVGLILAFIASLPFFLGWLVLIPVSLAGIYIAYRDIYGSDMKAAV